jgi:membrane protein YdbS with pleckstrin-like domain
MVLIAVAVVCLVIIVASVIAAAVIPGDPFWFAVVAVIALFAITAAVIVGIMQGGRRENGRYARHNQEITKKFTDEL